MKTNLRKSFGIYKIINTTNNKMYIGSTLRSFDKRRYDHFNLLRKGKHHSQHLQNSWNKHGEASFVFEPIESMLSKDKQYCFDRETYWIESYESYEDSKGYNIRKVAESNLGLKASKETKEKLSVSSKGRKATDEAKENMRLCKLGANNPMFGRKASEETKLKMREARLGKPMSEEAKKKVSAARKQLGTSWSKGKNLSEEHRRKIGEAQKGELNHNYRHGKYC